MDYLEAEKRQSSVIESMRFPLSCLVVLIHMVPFETPRIDLSFNSEALYQGVSQLLSHNLGGVVVPVFFMLSGYFYFSKIDSFSVKIYGLQLKKRFFSVLLPYVLWNLILIATMFGKYQLLRFSGFDLTNSRESLSVIHNSSWYQLLWGTPINFPLWYMRDLICMIVLAPLFFFWFRFMRKFGILLLTVFYLGVTQTLIPGLSPTAILFFGLGSYWGMHRQNILLVFAPFRKLSLVLAVLLLLISTFMNGTIYHVYFARVFILVGVIAIFYVFDYLSQRQSLAVVLTKFAPTSFFIYVAHKVQVISLLNGVWARLSLNEYGWVKLLGYFIVPLLTILICMGLYYLLNAAYPRFLIVLMGGRTSFIKRKGEKKI